MVPLGYSSGMEEALTMQNMHETEWDMIAAMSWEQDIRSEDEVREIVVDEAHICMRCDARYIYS